jgi:hypothetical protein
MPQNPNDNDPENFNPDQERIEQERREAELKRQKELDDQVGRGVNIPENQKDTQATMPKPEPSSPAQDGKKTRSKKAFIAFIAIFLVAVALSVGVGFLPLGIAASVLTIILGGIISAAVIGGAISGYLWATSADEPAPSPSQAINQPGQARQKEPSKVQAPGLDTPNTGVNSASVSGGTGQDQQRQ